MLNYPLHIATSQSSPDHWINNILVIREVRPMQIQVIIPWAELKLILPQCRHGADRSAHTMDRFTQLTRRTASIMSIPGTQSVHLFIRTHRQMCIQQSVTWHFLSLHPFRFQLDYESSNGSTLYYNTVKCDSRYKVQQKDVHVHEKSILDMKLKIQIRCSDKQLIKIFRLRCQFIIISRMRTFNKIERNYLLLHVVSYL